MRKVASYSLVASDLNGNAAADRIVLVRSLVRAWLDEKGSVVDKDDRVVLEFPDGRNADLQRRSLAFSQGELHHVALLEPNESGLFSTTVDIGRHDRSVAVYIELRAGSNATHVMPIRLDVRCPRLVRSILDDGGEWFVGEVPVTTKPIRLNGSDGGRWLTGVLWHPSRNLPVIAVSEFNGEAFSRDFAADLARDVSALAIVVQIDADCSWALTSEKGKEWSCYNGAIRLFWPIRSHLDRPRAHPLWTLPRILSETLSRNDASTRMRRQIRRRILSLSAFSVAEPLVFRMIRASARKEEADRLKADAADDIEWQSLAERYALDNDELLARVDDLEERLTDLQLQNTNLQTALSWQSEEDEISPETTTPPATVADAVGQAKDRFSDLLIFGEDVKIGVSSLAPDAGPPEKVLNYLSKLAELTSAMAKGGLGTSAIDWLRQCGVDASTESETTRNSSSEMQKRTWHDGTTRREFFFHLKPSEATSPDKCVRIYYDYLPEVHKTIVAWVGRHP